MADYKNIPVDQETYDMLLALCDAYERKQGAQVKAMVKTEYEKLGQVKLLPASVTKKSRAATRALPEGE